MTQAQEDAILVKYDELLVLLAPHTAVIPEDRRDNLVRLGPGRRAYDEKCDNYMHQKPLLRPAEIDLTEYDKDGEQLERWRRIEAKHDAVAQRMSDTKALLGSDRMAANNLFKNACLFGIRLGKVDAKAVYERISRTLRRRPQRWSPRQPAQSLSGEINRYRGRNNAKRDEINPKRVD